MLSQMNLQEICTNISRVFFFLTQNLRDPANTRNHYTGLIRRYRELIG